MIDKINKLNDLSRKLKESSCDVNFYNKEEIERRFLFKEIVKLFRSKDVEFINGFKTDRTL